MHVEHVDELYAVALVDTNVLNQRVLTWLVGLDANDSNLDDAERRRHDAMLARRGRRIVNRTGG